MPPSIPRSCRRLTRCDSDDEMFRISDVSPMSIPSSCLSGFCPIERLHANSYCCCWPFVQCSTLRTQCLLVNGFVVAPFVEPPSSSSAECLLLPAQVPVLLFVTCFEEVFLQRGKVPRTCEGLWDLGGEFQDDITDIWWLYLYVFLPAFLGTESSFIPSSLLIVQRLGDSSFPFLFRGFPPAVHNLFIRVGVCSLPSAPIALRVFNEMPFGHSRFWPV